MTTYAEIPRKNAKCSACGGPVDTTEETYERVTEFGVLHGFRETRTCRRCSNVEVVRDHATLVDAA